MLTACRPLGVILVSLGLLVPPMVGAQGSRARQHEVPGRDFAPDGVWRKPAGAVRATRRRLLAQRDFAALNAGAARAALLAPPQNIAASPAAVSGVLRAPLILFDFKDTDPGALVFSSGQYQSALFGSTPPSGRPYTLRSYYEQLSNGMFSVQGTAYGWVSLDSNEAYYTGPAGGCPANPYGTDNCNGVWGQGAVGEAVAGAVSKIDATTDFGQFDNDGPDGIPNSGDDDGFVDLVLLVYPTMDGACLSQSNNHLWAHRFSIPAYATNDPRAGGGFIQVRDYLMQSGLGGSGGCDVTQLMPIGTVSHEFGHGLGLPDLYDLSQATEGIGDWGLMGSGNWASQDSPARMEAWSLEQMGWVSVQDAATSGSYALTPAATGHTVLFVSPTTDNPRGEYFLLENRHAVFSDSAMIRIHCQMSGLAPGCDGGGLAVWHVDGSSFGNNVTPPLLALMQADGNQGLQNHFNRGDAGDPFPGTAGNAAFGPATNPSSGLNSGGPSGIALDNITDQVDQTVTFNLTLQVPAVATQLALITEPAGAVSGWPFLQQPAVQLRDASNQPVAQAGVVVTVSIASGSGVLTGFSAPAPASKGAAPASKTATALTTVTATTDANGIAAFSMLTITGTGDHTLTFSASNITGVTSSSFPVTDPVATALQNGVAVSGLSGPIRSTVFYVITLPVGVGQLTVSTGGGSGDADLYVRQGAAPTFSSYDCRPYTTGTVESCAFVAPAAGTWYIAVRGFSAYSGVTLLAQFAMGATQLALTTEPGGAVSGWPLVQQPVVQLRDANNQPVAQAGVVVTASIASGSGVLTGSSTPAPAGGRAVHALKTATAVSTAMATTVTAMTDANGVATFTTLTITGSGDHTLTFSASNLAGVTSASFPVTLPVATALQNGVAVTGLGGAIRSTAFYSITLPAGATQLAVSTSGGSGDADLYVRYGSAPTFSTYDCRPYVDGNVESCILTAPAAGAWYIAVQGFTDYAGVTLVAQYATAAMQLVLTTQPGGAVSGVPFTQQPVVALRDAQNQPVAQSGVVVTVVKASGSGVLGGTTAPPLTATTDGNGVATFAGLTITGTGDHTLSFSASNFTGVTSATFPVSAAAANQLALTTPPGGAVSGWPFVQQPVVELRDVSNQPVAQAGVVVTATVASAASALKRGPVGRVRPESGTLDALAAATATTDANGVATFTDLTITGNGSYTVGFSAPNLTGVTSASFPVVQPAATTLQNGVAVTGLAGAVRTTAFYAITLPAGVAQFTVSGNGANGLADLYLRQGAAPTISSFDCHAYSVSAVESCAVVAPAAGAWYVALHGLADYTGVTLVAQYTMAASQLVLASQPGGAVSGVPFTQQPVVQLRDLQNQPVAQSGVVVTAVIATGTGTMTPQPATATTDDQGRAAFAGLAITGTGSYTLDFTAPGLTKATSQSFTAAGASDIVHCLLGSCQLSSAETIALDGMGNHNGSLDLGDLLAWLDRSGTALDAGLVRAIESLQRKSQRSP